MHPGFIRSKNIELEESETILTPSENLRVFFTDASKIGDSNVGFAVVERLGNTYKTRFTSSVNSHHSVYEGESLAIEAVLSLIMSETPLDRRDAVIYTDSLSRFAGDKK